jgi:methylthioribose-1-phosphate isomerase
MAANNLLSLKYSNEGGKTPKLAVLDQLLIPHEKVYIDVPDVEKAWSVIRTMQIRGTCMRTFAETIG